MFVGQDAHDKNGDGDFDDEGENATTSITVVFEYDLPDIFDRNSGEGAGAPSTENRAKVTSASDSVGAWIKITEVADEGDPRSSSHEQHLPWLRHAERRCGRHRER